MKHSNLDSKNPAEVEGKAEELRATGATSEGDGVSRRSQDVGRKKPSNAGRSVKSLTPWAQMSSGHSPRRPHCKELLEPCSPKIHAAGGVPGTFR